MIDSDSSMMRLWRASALALFAVFAGCSSDEDPPSNVRNRAGNGGGTAAGGSAGKASTGGTAGKGGSNPGGSGAGGGSATGGTASGGAQSGTGGSATGGTGATGTGGTGGGTGGNAGDDSGGSAGDGTSGNAGTSSAGTSSAGTSSAGSSGTGNQTAALTIAVIGSSTPAGKNLNASDGYGGTSVDDSWVNRYADYLEDLRPGSQVINLALAGIGTWEGLPSGSTNSVGAPAPDPAHNITAAIATNPDAIIVNFPSGDIIDDWTVDQVMANLASIEDAAENADIPIWIATSQPRNDGDNASSARIAQYEEQRDRTLADYGARALDFWSPLADESGLMRTELMLTDDQHPNAEGHRLLFEVVVGADLPGNL